LKLVDEKKSLKRITDLKATRKQLATFSSAEESIKLDVAKRKGLQDELSSATSTPEAKALSEDYNRIHEEMTKLKKEKDDAFAKKGELKSQRDELQKQRDKAYEHKKSVQDSYYEQRNAYRAWNEQNRKVLLLPMRLKLMCRLRVRSTGNNVKRRNVLELHNTRLLDLRMLLKMLLPVKFGSVRM
jgi:uncharacterized coiled-coil DUF342 family protein